MHYCFIPRHSHEGGYPEVQSPGVGAYGEVGCGERIALCEAQTFYYFDEKRIQKI